jgi:hypothetical protein
MVNSFQADSRCADVFTNFNECRAIGFRGYHAVLVACADSPEIYKNHLIYIGTRYGLIADPDSDRGCFTKNIRKAKPFVGFEVADAAAKKFFNGPHGRNRAPYYSLLASSEGLF